MTRNDAIDLARGHALAHGQAGDHAYLPTTEAKAAEWLPHAWVVDAMLAANNIGRAIQSRVTEAAFDAVNRNADLGEAATQELRNIAEAKRFDRERFDDDTSFADWAQSRARHALGA